MNIKSEPTYQVKLYLSGPIEVAKQIIRRECLKEGLCVTIEPTTFIYTGGEECGYVVGLINYPRFPKNETSIWTRAYNLAEILLEETFQHSALITDKETTIWMTKREV
jgi:hypothetical protein